MDLSKDQIDRLLAVVHNNACQSMMMICRSFWGVPDEASYPPLPPVMTTVGLHGGGWIDPYPYTRNFGVQDGDPPPLYATAEECMTERST